MPCRSKKRKPRRSGACFAHCGHTLPGIVPPKSGTLRKRSEHPTAPENVHSSACTASFAPWPISRPLPGISTRITPGTRRETLRVLCMSFYAFDGKMQRGLCEIFDTDQTQPGRILTTSSSTLRTKARNPGKSAPGSVQLVRRNALRLWWHCEIRINRQLEIPVALGHSIDHQLGNHVQQLRIHCEIDTLPLLRMHTQ